MTDTPMLLVAIDNDGCLIRNQHVPFDLEFAARMRDYAHRGEEAPGRPVPQFTFLTGRPQPFVECLQKVFGTSLPAIYEYGAGLDLGGESRAMLHPKIDDDALVELARLRSLLRGTVLKDIPSFIQPGKDGIISVIPYDMADHGRLMDACEELAEREKLPFAVVRAVRAMDFMLPGINKAAGLVWLAEYMDIPVEQIAGIGDSRGDLDFLQKCAWAGCPANAVDAVKDVVDYVSPHEAHEGVLDIMEKIIEKNE